MRAFGLVSLLASVSFGKAQANWQNTTSICPRVNIKILDHCSDAGRIVSVGDSILEIDRNGQDYTEHRILDNHAQQRGFCLLERNNLAQSCLSSSISQFQCEVLMDKNILKLNEVTGLDSSAQEELLHQVFFQLTQLFEEYDTVYVSENHYSEICCLFKKHVLKIAEQQKFCVFQEAAFDYEVKENLFYGLSTTNKHLEHLKSLHSWEKRIDNLLRSKRDIVGAKNRLDFCQLIYAALETLDPQLTKGNTEDIQRFLNAFSVEKLDFNTLLDLYNKALEKVDRIRERKWATIINAVSVEKKLIILGSGHIDAFISQNTQLS